MRANNVVFKVLREYCICMDASDVVFKVLVCEKVLYLYGNRS